MSTSPTRLGSLSALKLALTAKKVRAEAQEVLRADPIAIVGMACRVPGGGDSPARFWELLRAGADAVREVPADRWDADAWFDPDPAAPGKSMTKWGGFLDAIDAFDAAYFGILPREAERMDPQQRLLLEVAVEALDDAGLPQERLRGARAGVFIASYNNDYEHLQREDVEAVDARTLTGTLHSVLANRLSYFLDLRGPSLSIDTACSSSLVAAHLACQSLRAGESDVAVAGGVSLMVTPDMFVSLSKVGFMAPDGRSKAFDARADGFGRGEGCGVVVLKRLADAIADGDRVLAVIRGSAVNQDGHSTLLAAPNGLAQQALLAEALACAQLEPERIGYVETHGTGTALGDPIEIEALAATLGRPSPAAGTCLLGAVKANLGHLEAAAGVIGLIKTVLVLTNEAVPGQVHFTRLNPHISLEGTRFAIPTALTPWRSGAAPRCAGVSSFGVGGTNAHVILEEAPRLPAASASPSPGAARILPLSAQSPEALRALAEAWTEFLRRTSAPVDDLCYTATQRRTHYDRRLAVVGRTKEELCAALAERLGDPGAFAASGTSADASLRAAFVFSGQGPQWHAMGRELLAEEPVFRAAIEECDALLRPLSGWSLLEELGADEGRSRLAQTEIAQPALFALQVALAALWRSWGVSPSAVVGHSVGEIAALHVAGVLALPDAVRAVWHRARIMQRATGLGRMAQVALTPEAAAETIRRWGERLSVGAVNAPRNVVLSGETAALEEALAALAERGVEHRMLPVQYAFHSAQMAPFQRLLADELAGLPRSAPAMAVYSTVSGELATDERFDGAYFGRNVREPVRFASAIAAMARDGHDVFVELAPHPVLAASIAECVEEAGRAARVVASLRRGRPERETMLQACARLYEAGASPGWHAIQRAPGNVTSLPPYPWQRKRHWIRSRAPSAARAATAPDASHPLLGRPVAAAGIRARIFEGGWEGTPAWVADHRVFGRLVLPGAAILEAFHAAAAAALGSAKAQVGGFAMHRPLFLPEPDEGRARWQIVVTPAEPGRAELELHEAVGSDGHEVDWRRVASASATLPPSVAALPAVARPCADPVAADAVYQRFAALGVAFGPTFRSLDGVRRGDGAAEGWIALPAALEPSARVHGLHPLLLDGALQLCSLAAPRGPGGELPADVLLPMGADRFDVLGPAPERVLARARVREAGAAGSLAADVILETPDGEPVAVLEGMRFARAQPDAFAERGALDDSTYVIGWERIGTGATRAPTPDAGEGRWLVLADRGGAGDALVRALEATGERCTPVASGDRFERTSGGGFVLDPADPQHLERLFAEAGPPRGVVHLLALDVAPLDRATSAAHEEEERRGVGSLLHVVQGLLRATGGAACPLWVVTRGAQSVTGEEPPGALRPRAAGVWGLASVIAVEHPELRVRRVDLDPAEDAAGCAGLAGEILGRDDGRASVALRGVDRWIPRLERRPLRRAGAERDVERDAPVHLELVRPGTLDGIELRRRPRAALRRDEIRLSVLAAGINFRDVLLTLGMYPGGEGASLGAECAGVVTEVGADVREFAVGARVFGFARDSLATEVTVPAAHVAPIPPGMSTEDAAGMPVAFLTAYYGLHRLARLRSGERVLVHAAAGGVGLAALQLAQRCGAEVFATAGSEAKRELLRSLGVRHVLDSRSLAFAEQIRAATAGEGVHVVLNSLASDFIPASLGTLAPGGRFLELGKRGILTPESAARLRPDVRYWAYDLGAEVDADRGLMRPMMDEILAALARGELRPLPVTVYALDRACDAFRFMAQARHVGKLVLRVASGALVSDAATYWITGGLGGLGLETARWLSRSGATHLVLSGRRRPGPAALAAVREIERQGTTVRVHAADVADRAATRRILEEIREGMPPLRGVIHAAGAVDDAVLLRQTWERGREVLRGKAEGAWVLHELTRDLPLDFFVMYSAAGLLLGAPGQGFYPAANAELDALAHARRRLGLPALSVAWGSWAEVGMAADLAARGNDVWAARGLGKITPAFGFARLEQLMRDGATHAAVLPIRWDTFLGQLPAGADRAFFRAVAAGRGSDADAPRAHPPAALVARLRAMPPGQRRHALTADLADRARQVIGLEAATPIDPAIPLKELGLDSLMAVELRNTLTRAVGQPLPATLLFDHPTLQALAGHLARRLGLEADAGREAAGADAPARKSARDVVAALSDEEAEAALLAELEPRGSRSP